MKVLNEMNKVNTALLYFLELGDFDEPLDCSSALSAGENCDRF